MTPESLFDDRVRNDPARPLLTFYDDSTGERAELSAKSLGNWVAKTHFLIVDELGLGPGDRAFVRLPVHWLAMPVLLGCWFAGLEVITGVHELGTAAVVFADADALAALDQTGPEDRFAVSLLSMARSAEPPPGAADFAASVRPQPDAWPAVRPLDNRDEAVALDGLTRGELVSHASDGAEQLGLAAGGRLLWTSAEFGAAQWPDALIAPLTVAGSTVLVRNSDPGTVEARIRSERITAVR